MMTSWGLPYSSGSFLTTIMGGNNQRALPVLQPVEYYRAAKSEDQTASLVKLVNKSDSRNRIHYLYRHHNITRKRLASGCLRKTTQICERKVGNRHAPSIHVLKWLR